ncbi:WXG100 family type VII secretion target [Actinoplanes sp. NPDC049118]|uniref:WXG100 family type VII secretion target n=1 Tax=Actinoplanes sp. NPDC049118 TaxID=3155769 RepID=UPI00340DF39C
MASNLVSTTEPGMQAAANLFGDTVSTFNGYLRTINGDMATLQASWVGTASNSFNQAMDTWESAFTTVINELIGMMDSMGVNTKTYSEAEETATNMAQPFAAALPGV